MFDFTTYFADNEKLYCKHSAVKKKKKHRIQTTKGV